MKKTLLIIVSVLAVSLTYAQSLKEEVQIFQNVFGREKKAAVAEFIKIDDDKKRETFWALYDAYETKRKELGEKRIALIADYASNYSDLTDEKIESLIKQTVQVNEALDKLIVQYYKKMKKPIGVKTAAQFAQVENYFLAGIRYELSSRLPFIQKLK